MPFIVKKTNSFEERMSQFSYSTLSYAVFIHLKNISSKFL